jgi:hypothetical protein
MEPTFLRLLEPYGLPFATGRVREAGRIHRDLCRRGTSPGKGFVEPVQKLGVQSFQCSIEEGMTGWSPKTESTEELWLKGNPGHEITISQAGIELESKENKQHRERKLHRATTARPDIGNGIAKAHKLMK